MHTAIITSDVAFDDTHGAFYGSARFNCSTDHYCDADIGGFDGWATSAELIDAKIGTSTVDRDWLVNAFGEAMVAGIEAEVSEDFHATGEAA